MEPSSARTPPWTPPTIATPVSGSPERVWAAPLPPPKLSPTSPRPVLGFLSRLMVGEPPPFVSGAVRGYRHPSLLEFSPDNDRGVPQGPAVSLGVLVGMVARWILIFWLAAVGVVFSPLVLALFWLLAACVVVGFVFAVPWLAAGSLVAYFLLRR
ncbi:hypothetical protein DFJ74DRAFT_709136 [Hyaloraphidium curvatum]|nr:hypothetical protein DFJ74DRAFT_709136 [Hyaloraphidium curvatum]